MSLVRISLKEKKTRRLFFKLVFIFQNYCFIQITALEKLYLSYIISPTKITLTSRRIFEQEHRFYLVNENKAMYSWN